MNKLLDNRTIVVRLLIAFVLGALVGIERYVAGKPAGIKTYSMVSMGSCLTMLLGIYVYYQFPKVNVDPTRIAAQVVSGIGFLGALCVFKNKASASIFGLTTASSIWVIACIGLAVGGGFILGAVATTALILLNLIIIPKLERLAKKLFKNKSNEEEEHEEDEL